MKNLTTIILLACLLAFVSCKKNQDVENDILIEGTVTIVDRFGGLNLSFTPQEMESKGIEYGDLLLIKVGDDIEFPAPYVDAFTEAGSMSPCICNYNKQGESFCISLTNGSFARSVGGKAGDKVVIKMKTKKGYLKEYQLLQGTYTFAREDYPSDEAFANFREMKTTGLKAGVLYRSTSPINFKRNKVRYTYAAALCQKNGIKTVIDIADSDAKVQKYMAAPENDSSYMHQCLDSGNIVGLGSNADYIHTLFLDKVARAMRAIIEKPAPYLVHCNEGKDRTGFYCILLEALCGATENEMKEDYMATFENLYHQTKGSEQYELTWRKNGFRMLYMIVYPETWENVMAIDWTSATLEGADLKNAAEQYILRAGLSQQEIADLRAKLTN